MISGEDLYLSTRLSQWNFHLGELEGTLFILIQVEIVRANGTSYI